MRGTLVVLAATVTAGLSIYLSVPSGKAPEVTFHTCAEVYAAGLSDLPQIHPGYQPALDGDADGFACEDAYDR